MTIIPEPSNDNPTSFRRHSEEQPKPVRPFQRDPPLSSLSDDLPKPTSLSDDPPKTISDFTFTVHFDFHLRNPPPLLRTHGLHVLLN